MFWIVELPCEVFVFLGTKTESLSRHQSAVEEGPLAAEKHLALGTQQTSANAISEGGYDTGFFDSNEFKEGAERPIVGVQHMVAGLIDRGTQAQGSSQYKIIPYRTTRQPILSGVSMTS